MPTEIPPAAESNAERRPGRPRWIAAGFLFAFGLSIVTVILTGLWVRSPDARDAPAAREAWHQGQERRAEPAPSDESADDAAAERVGEPQERQ